MAGMVRLDRRGATATIVLDHPERRNALTVEMWEQIPLLVAEVAETASDRVLVVRGAGEEAFASGADISEFETTRSTADQNIDYDRLVSAATRSLAELGKPVVAAVHGFCLGGGLGLALGADLRIAADDASFAIPAARLGVGYNIPGVATLLGLIGPSSTKRLLFTGERVFAGDALAMGLVDEVHPKAELDDRVIEMCATIGRNAPLTIAAVKLAVRGLTSGDDGELDGARSAVRDCFDSEDFAEGVRAFLTKRPPSFQGR